MILHYETWGNHAHPPMILLHGMGGTGKMYRPLAADLETAWYVIAPDQRGHGGSFVAPDPTGAIDPQSFAPEHYAQDLRETLAPLGLGPAALVAHSMGVRTAIHYADQDPSAVRGLVLVDLNFSGLAGGGFGQKLEKVLHALPEGFPTRQAAREFLQDRSPERSVTQFLVAVLEPRKDGGGFYFPFQNKALLQTMEFARNHSLLAPLNRIHARGVPVLVVRGGDSTVWTSQEFRTYQGQFPNFRFEEIAGAGHGVPFEKREAFTRLLQEFFYSR